MQAAVNGGVGGAATISFGPNVCKEDGRREEDGHSDTGKGEGGGREARKGEGQVGTSLGEASGCGIKSPRKAGAGSVLQAPSMAGGSPAVSSQLTWAIPVRSLSKLFPSSPPCYGASCHLKRVQRSINGAGVATVHVSMEYYPKEEVNELQSPGKTRQHCDCSSALPSEKYEAASLERFTSLAEHVFDAAEPVSGTCCAALVARRLGTELDWGRACRLGSPCSASGMALASHPPCSPLRGSSVASLGRGWSSRVSPSILARAAPKLECRCPPGSPSSSGGR